MLSRRFDSHRADPVAHRTKAAVEPTPLKRDTKLHQDRQACQQVPTLIPLSSGEVMGMFQLVHLLCMTSCQETGRRQH